MACTGARTVALLLSVISITQAQTVTTYSYDNLQRLTQASATDGASTQYQYDANGNVTNITQTSGHGLVLNPPLSVNLAVPGQSATLTFAASSGETIAIALGSITTTPSGHPVTISAYTSSGTLLSSTSGTTSASLILSNLTAGNYSVVIAPDNTATGVVQVTLTSQPVSDGSADAPLPLWALVVLGGGLLGIGQRAGNRQRRIV